MASMHIYVVPVHWTLAVPCMHACTNFCLPLQTLAAETILQIGIPIARSSNLSASCLA